MYKKIIGTASLFVAVFSLVTVAIMWQFASVAEACGIGNWDNCGACELAVEKGVDKTSASVGDDLTYTIKVTNIGTASCAGGVVKVIDVVDPKLEYKSHQLLGGGSGYGGNVVYKSDDRTLQYSAQAVAPNESVTVKWTGKIKEPAQCGSFSVKSEAKATAIAIGSSANSSQSASASASAVATVVNHHCQAPAPAPKPAPTHVCKVENISSRLVRETDNNFTVSFTNNNDCKFDVGASSYLIPVDSGKLCTWQNKKLDCQVRHAYQDIKLLPGETREITVSKPSKCYQYEWYYGVSVKNLDYSLLGDPVLSYVISLNPYKERIFDAKVDPLLSVERCKTPEPAPSCDYLRANIDLSSPISVDTKLTLSWGTTNATRVFINEGIGSVPTTGSRDYTVSSNKNFFLTAVGADGREAYCELPVKVKGVDPKPNPFTCANNVDFTATDYSIKEGGSTKLNWKVTGADSISINGINNPGFSGNQTVSPSSDITYTLKATKDNQTINCPLDIKVSKSSSGGGGGGGGVSLRCELEVSDDRIKKGDEIKISWETKGATNLRLTDDKGETLFTTDNYLANDKKEYYNHSIKVKPTRDTRYTLTAERGSSDKECKVDVKVEDGGIVVLETRDQQPRVSGIALSQVPYTGFEAGPVLTMVFYLLLTVWALSLTYLLIIRRRTATVDGSIVKEDIVSEDVSGGWSYSGVPASRSATTIATAVGLMPSNLPTAKTNDATVSLDAEVVDDQIATRLEDFAHAQRALLSSDAIRLLVSMTKTDNEREEWLSKAIASAKQTYPLEDGWVVINEQRMLMSLEACGFERNQKVHALNVAAIPSGSGSLAEAIVTGNVVAAYEMIGNRPMIALADASADLDALYRFRNGGDQAVSEMLKRETERLSDDQIRQAINALTSAIDGTYTDEASAVKMAIMKAVKAVS